AQTLGLTLMGLGAALLLSSNLPSIGPNTVTALLVTAAVATGTGHGLSYWGANREIDLLTPAKNRAGISAALYLALDRKSTRLNSSHVSISYAVFCLKKKIIYTMQH